MGTDADEVNEALVTFLGFSHAIAPRSDRAALVARFGEQRAAVLEGLICTLIEEALSIDPQWSHYPSLPDAAAHVIEKMRMLHSGLSEEALRALAWRFTFDWR